MRQNKIEHTDGKKSIGTFETFQVIRPNAGFLGLGVEVQRQLVTSFYSEDEGFTSEKKPLGKPVVTTIGKLKKEIVEKTGIPFDVFRKMSR